jgi:hypothetical protein
MDKQEFIHWFTGGVAETHCTLEQATLFIEVTTSENGAEVSQAEIDTYLGWLREEGIIAG